MICNALLSRRSPYYSSFPIQPLREMVARMVPCADIVFVAGLFLAEALSVPRQRTLVDINDLEEAKVARRAQVTPGRVFRWALRQEAARLGAVESQAPKRFARLAVCSETDAARWPDAADQVWVVPNGTDDSLFGREPVAKIPCRLVFVGTMTYGPNEDALMYFVSEILPSLIEREPRVSLSIVGKSPSAAVRRLHDGARVFVHPDVPDVAPYVQQAVVSIVPLRVAGGTRLKILESLALRTPVVSTTIGAEGLNLRDGRDLLLADTAPAFADAVLRLLQDTQASEQFSRQGAARVQEMYRWSTVRRQLTAQVEKWAATLASAAERGAG